LWYRIPSREFLRHVSAESVNTMSHLYGDQPLPPAWNLYFPYGPMGMPYPVPPANGDQFLPPSMNPFYGGGFPPWGFPYAPPTPVVAPGLLPNSGTGASAQFQRPRKKNGGNPKPEAEEINEVEVQRLADLWAAQIGADDKFQALADKAFENATCSQESSRAMQKVIEDLCDEDKEDDAAAFVSGLRHHVKDAIDSKHGNFVIERILEKLGPKHASFVVEDLRGSAAFYARHRYGCRVLSQLLSNLSREYVAAIALIEELLQDTDALIRHNYGCHVIQSIVEYGLPEHRSIVAQAVRCNIYVSATYKNASLVIQMVLKYGCDGDKKAIVDALLGNLDELQKLAINKCGCHAVLEVLSLRDENSSRLANPLRLRVQALRATRYGTLVADRLT